MDGIAGELKALVDIVQSLLQLALWVAIGFWAIIIGSIYGVIRFCVDRAYKAYTIRVEQKKYAVTEVRDWKGIGVITNSEKDMVVQLKRLRYRFQPGAETSEYIHENGVMILEAALDAYFADPNNAESLKRVVG